ncbi:MAG: DUF177 domain-containing protein [Sphingomonadales bacterium]|jgi:uncharacterized metal-binding protein YceD (DUF177 family)
MSEFSHIIRAHEVGGVPRKLSLAADPAQRAALVTRFALLSLDSLTATLELRREAGGIRVVGQVQAKGAQPCVASGEPVPFRVKETLALLLTQAVPDGGEIELASDDLDVEPLDGDAIDAGEIAAQAFALALDPYPRLPGAVPGVISEDEAVAARSPFAVLKKG